MKKLSLFFNKLGIIFCAVAGASVMIILCFIIFRLQVNSYIDEDMHSQIEAIQINSSMLIKNEMNYLKRLTASGAQTLSLADIQTDEDILQALEDYSDASGIICTRFITLDGRLYSSKQGYLGQSDQYKTVDGRPLSEITSPIFSKAYYSEDLDAVIFGVIAPATMGGYEGVFISSYDVEEFSKLLTNNFIGGSSEIGIFNSKGEVISGKSPEEFMLNIFDPLSKTKFKASSVETMREDFAKGNSGFSIYSVGGVARYCTYAPMGLNDWYVVVMVRELSLRGRLVNLERYGFQLAVELVIIMAGLLCVIVANRRTEQKRKRMILEQAAMMDGLTGIYNRKAIEELIEQSLQKSGEALHAALLIIDLDDFKKVNDQGGHIFGDSVLRECASRLNNLFGDDGLVGRIGGDEFVVFLRDGRNMEHIEEQVHELIHNFYVLTEAGKKWKISVSVGIAHAGPKANSFLLLYQAADAALYRAKQTGKARLSD